MSEVVNFDAYKKKLQGICDENNLTFRFRNDKYPITLTIRPLAGVDEQMTMLERVEENGYTSPDASIVFYFRDGEIAYKTSQTIMIKETLFNKIKNLAKNLHYCWLQYFFRTIIETNALKAGKMPVIDEDEADDTDAYLPDGAEPLDTYDDLDEEELPELDDETLDDEADPEIEEAIRIVRAENKASTSLLQRRMSIGYGKATRLIKTLEEMGVVGPYDGNTPREVLPYDVPDDEGAEA